MLALNESVLTNTTLEELCVNHNEIAFGTRDGAGNDLATTVCELLTTNTTLKSLDIRNSHFDEASMTTLDRPLPLF